MKYFEILKFIKDNNEKSFENVVVKFKLLSNITLLTFEDNFRYHLLKQNINLEFNANLHNVFADSTDVDTLSVYLVHIEFREILDHFTVNNIQASEDVFERISKSLNFVFENMVSCKHVFFASFSTFFINEGVFNCFYENLCAKLNIFLYENAPKNFEIVNLNKIYDKLNNKDIIEYKGISDTIYHKNHFNFSYSQLIANSLLKLVGMKKKVLILDCDNTLWRGIVGEDGIDSVLNSNDKVSDYVFKEIRKFYKKLISRGVLLALASKNNEHDVMEVLKSNHFPIKPEEFVCHRINWDEKYINLQSISEELNLNVNSFVFIDDSEFEISLIKKFLPSVTTLHVPNNIQDYLNFMITLESLFYSVLTVEDLTKLEQYKQEKNRKISSQQFSNKDEFIDFLNLEIVYNWKNVLGMDRLSQMSMKTNQFNLTLNRYTVSEIEALHNSGASILSVAAKDIYGDYGVIGLIILIPKASKLVIDTFLMSCRVIGRNIERNMIDTIINFGVKNNFDQLIGLYKLSNRNIQVSNFYNQFGFVENPIFSNENIRYFEYQLKSINSEVFTKNIFRITNNDN